MKKSPPPSDFRKLLDSLDHRHNPHKVFSAFTRFAACALAMQTREPEYFEEMKQWQKDDMSIFATALGALVMDMEAHPFEDLLGGYYMEQALSKKGQQWNGEFHTPPSICELMARMTLSDLEKFPADQNITICEPACGAGAMILAIGKVCDPAMLRRLRVTAIDINPIACDMCFINTTLWGIPTRVIHGNTISNEMWKAWSNIHYIMPWLPLALRIKSPEAQAQGQPPTIEETQAIATHVAEHPVDPLYASLPLWEQAA
ncbi:MAG TPA: N-6 DNA methylase [Verrucomicrobiae bacterium]|jgi:type I restriction-modification system DNA methylase subunit|nr:N-6 DNA methylase [Verrucomicrobiae bacterium]